MPVAFDLTSYHYHYAFWINFIVALTVSTLGYMRSVYLLHIAPWNKSLGGEDNRMYSLSGHTSC